MPQPWYVQLLESCPLYVSLLVIGVKDYRRLDHCLEILAALSSSVVVFIHPLERSLDLMIPIAESHDCPLGDAY